MRVQLRRVDTSMPQPNGRGWLIGHDHWCRMGYELAQVRDEQEYRAWLRARFSDDMLMQWVRMNISRELPPSWQGVLAAEVQRRQEVARYREERARRLAARRP